MKPAAVALAGSALLVAVAILHLPPPAALTRRVATPFDRTRDPGAAPAFVLFAQASTLIPTGSAVAVAAASKDPRESEYCYRLAAGLLPNLELRRPPEATTPDAGAPQYLIVVGAGSPAFPGERLLQTPQGTVWRLHD
ncbi:MAG: hypothetical protein ACM3SU_14255 [Acidobacteriota bacterium]